MKYLLLLYLLTIVSLTATRVSLLKGNKLRWLAIVLPSIIAVCFYSFSLKQNNQLLDWLVSQPNLISGIAMALTFEAIIILVLTVVQIKSFYSIKYPNLWKWISVIPTFQFVISLAVAILTWFMVNQVDYLLNKDLGFNKDNVLIRKADTRQVGEQTIVSDEVFLHLIGMFVTSWHVPLVI